jgi:nucleoside-diphosphate-sugar epimerase
MINVLVTGSKGYLGSVLCKLLQQNNNIKIFEFDNCLYNEKLYLTNKDKDFRHIDFSKYEKIDVVIHLAGISTNYDPPEKIYSELAIELNHKATVEFANKSKKAGINTFIFASSASVYGESNEGYVNEESNPNPLTSYAISKLKAENDLIKLKGDGFSPIILRMVTLFGLSERMRFDVLINNLIISSLYENKIILQSDGKGTRPQVHLKDVCKIYESIVLNYNRDLSGEIINIGRSDYNISVIEFAEELSKIMGCKLQIGKEETVDKRSYIVDFTKQNLLFPQIKFENDLFTAFNEIKNQYFDQIELDSIWYKDNKYYNLKQMKYLIESGILTNDLQFK